MGLGVLASGLVALGWMACARGITEIERLEEYSRRGYTWPPRYVPQTNGWRRLMERRERQIMALDDSQQRWDGWTTLVASAALVQNFTATGFAKARAPEHVIRPLVAALEKGLAEGEGKGTRYEDTPTHQIDVIRGGLRPKFIDHPHLNRQVIRDLQPLLEEWSGLKLKPAIAYGTRVYQNGSALLMHIDKVEDHIISAILHIGHDDDSEAWPLVIEGFDGNTHAVNMESGDMLFYESAKCMHGRPTTFVGEYYASIFIHYLPVDWGLSVVDTHYMVPPHWRDPVQTAAEPEPRLEIVGTGFREPECLHAWCNADQAARKAAGNSTSTHRGHNPCTLRVKLVRGHTYFPRNLPRPVLWLSGP